MKNLKEMIAQSVKKIQTEAPGFNPKIGIILGTGLGGLAREIKTLKAIPYEQIPHFPLSTVESHHGTLVLGELEGKAVVAMRARCPMQNPRG